MKRHPRCLLAMLLAGTLLFGGFPPESVGASEMKEAGTGLNDTEEPGETEGKASGTEETPVRISDEEAFLRLAEESRDERATLGRYFRLEKDLDFTGRDFRPIALFSGNFDGGGHLIRGISLPEEASVSGLVRTVGKEGCIRNLRAEGRLCPGGDGELIGGIAGVNYGRIEGCTFSGTLEGEEYIGGIAGKNAETGTVVSSNNLAKVQGSRRIGGIAGLNEGSILSCENLGTVNERDPGLDSGKEDGLAEGSQTEAGKEVRPAEESQAGAGKDGILPEEENEEENNLDSLIPESRNFSETFLSGDFSSLFSEDGKISAIGGIAGENEGVLMNCRNTDRIGALHTGYEVGGISGYERGVTSGNENEGAVYGRKNVGGIAGLFEPRAVNEYVRDAYDDAREDLDLLVEEMSALQSAAKGEDDRLQALTDAVRSDVDLLRETIRQHKEYYRAKDDFLEQEIRGWTNDLRSKAEETDFRDSDRSRQAMEALRQEIETAKHMADAASEASASGVDVDLVNYMGRSAGLLQNVLDQTAVLLEDAEKSQKSGKQLKEDLEELRGTAGGFLDFLRGSADSYKEDLRRTEAEIRERADRVYEDIRLFADTLKDSDGTLRKRITEITESMEGLNRSLDRAGEEVDRVLEDTREHVGALEAAEAFDDISDTVPEAAGRGVIGYCVNRGPVRADFNAGGIAGTAAVMEGVLSDFEIESLGEGSLKYIRTRQATFYGCRNYGDITSTSGCAGGILGRSEMGALVSCGSFANVRSEDGDYTGGIAGKMKGTIRDCQAMGVFEGDSFVGGIAGYGRDLLSNLCLPALEEGPRHGALAGDTDPEGTVSGNYFLDCGVGAVNGRTVEGEARSVSYEELIQLPGAPEDFLRLRVTFMDGGEVIDTRFVPYGGSLSAEEYPSPPSGADSFGFWEEADLTDLRRNRVVEFSRAEYTATAASEEEKPVLLVSGNFYAGTVVRYSTAPGSGTETPLGRLLDIWEFRLENPHGLPPHSMEEGCTVRLLETGGSVSYEEGEITAAVEENRVLTACPTRRDGSYLVFQVPREGTFQILRKKERGFARFLPYFPAAVLLIAAAVLLRRFRKKGKQAE